MGVGSCSHPPRSSDPEQGLGASFLGLDPRLQTGRPAHCHLHSIMVLRVLPEPHIPWSHKSDSSQHCVLMCYLRHSIDTSHVLVPVASRGIS